MLMNFNPRSSCEERLCLLGAQWFLFYFNPRSSCEERLSRRYVATSVNNFNPRSSCEERLYTQDTAVLDPTISIHAPHARSDCVTFKH